MAGDWIKMRNDLRTHPKVVRISSALKADRLRVVGGLHAVWCIFDAHSADGKLEGYSPETLDELIGWPGFSVAMIAVAWLVFDGESLMTPEFAEHNGQSAKRRALDSERKRGERIVQKVSASDEDKKRTREEKRRDISIPLTPKPISRKTSQAVGLKAYLDQCKTGNSKPIPEDDSVFDYATKAGIDTELLRLQWLEFKERYLVDGAKRYKCWPAVFGKSVRGNWFKLWYALPDGGYALTTVGLQAQRNHKAGP